MTLDVAQRRQLVALARRSIELGLDLGQRAARTAPADAALETVGSSFVTLHVAGSLRGCCGTLTAERTLAEDVWRNAWACAFADPRFDALSMHEWHAARVHISVLGPLERLHVENERELLEVLRPHVDGLCLTHGARQATFLPAVWQELPDPAAFVQHLKRKAGWPADLWPENLIVERYASECFGESD